MSGGHRRDFFYPETSAVAPLAGRLLAATPLAGRGQATGRPLAAASLAGKGQAAGRPLAAAPLAGRGQAAQRPLAAAPLAGKGAAAGRLLAAAHLAGRGAAAGRPPALLQDESDVCFYHTPSAARLRNASPAARGRETAGPPGTECFRHLACHNRRWKGYRTVPYPFP